MKNPKNPKLAAKKIPPEPIFSNISENKKTVQDLQKNNQPAPPEQTDTPPLANVFSISACIYCGGKNIVKRGKRKKKHERVQLYFCKDCARTFTGQTLKGKQYPARMVLDGVSYYNMRPLKKSLRETSEASDEAILISKRDCFAPFSRSQ